MKKLYYLICLLICVTIGYISGRIDALNARELIFNQEVNLNNLEDTYSKLSLPEPIILKSFELEHFDKSKTTFNIIDFATTTPFYGFYNQNNDVLNVRIENYDGDVPVISLSVLIHELVHQTTIFNHKDCKDFYSVLCQEKMAYDTGKLYDQIIVLKENNQIKLIK